MTIVRRLFTLGSIYALTLALGFALYVALVRSPLFGGVSILFYRGTILAIVAALLLGLISFFAAKKFRAIDLSSALGAIAISLSFNICFLVLFPVTIDRSVTVFMLSRMEAAQRPVTEQDLKNIFDNEYLGKMQQIHRRIEEQSLTGNIRVDNGQVTLTPAGKKFLSVSRSIGKIFGTDPRFVAYDQPQKAAAKK